jgi:hypothetical protein
MVETARLCSYIYKASVIARMAKLADALASGASDRKVLGVQVPLRAQKGLACRGLFFYLKSIL